MATSGSVSSTAGFGGSFIRLDWERTAVNTTTRISTVRYRLYLCLRGGVSVIARESGYISTTYAGDSHFSRGTTSRGPNGDHLLHEYYEDIYHYDDISPGIVYFGKFTSGWPVLGTMLTHFMVDYIDAMPWPDRPQQPPAKYWVGGTGVWDNTAGTKWSTTYGGPGGAPVPTANDNVYINSGNVTLGIDTPHIHTLTTAANFNMNGRTITAERAQLGAIGATFNMNGGALRVYRDLSFPSGHTNLDGGKIEIVHGGAIEFIPGMYGRGGIVFRPISTVSNAETATITVGVNTTNGEPTEIDLGPYKEIGTLRVLLGSTSSGSSIVNFKGDVFTNDLIIVSRNGEAHTVNFDSGTSEITTKRLVAVGGSTADRLTLNGGEQTNIVTKSNGAVYGESLSINDINYGYEGSPTPGYIGSNSIVSNSVSWLIQDPPKISTLVDEFGTLNTSRWSTSSYGSGDVTINNDRLMIGWGGGTSGAEVISTDTFDALGQEWYVTLDEYSSDIGMLVIVGDTIWTLDGTDAGETLRYRFSSTPEGYVTISKSNGGPWEDVLNKLIDPLLLRSTRVSIGGTRNIANGYSFIDSVGVTPPATNTSNFLPFFLGVN